MHVVTHFPSPAKVVILYWDGNSPVLPYTSHTAHPNFYLYSEYTHMCRVTSWTWKLRVQAGTYCTKWGPIPTGKVKQPWENSHLAGIMNFRANLRKGQLFSRNHSTAAELFWSFLVHAYVRDNGLLSSNPISTGASPLVRISLEHYYRHAWLCT